MKKKRSKGVTFWGLAFIVFCAVGLLSSIKPHPGNQFYGISYQIFSVVGYQIFSVVLSLSYLICGIFILKLNETARKTAIVLVVISVLAIPIWFKPTILKDATIIAIRTVHAEKREKITEQVKPEYQQEALEDLEKSMETAGKVIPISIIVFGVIPVLIFNLTPIYFFTRPKVKEQFKEEGAANA